MFQTILARVVMTLGRLSLPIPEELLAQSALRRSSPASQSFSHHAPLQDQIEERMQMGSRMCPENRLSQLINDFEFHSQRATEAAKRIQELLQTIPSRKGPNGILIDEIKGTSVMHALESTASSAKTNLQVTSIQKAFVRKPRSLARIDEDAFAATAMDGSLSIWCYSKQNKMKQLQLEEKVHAECMASSADHILLATAHKNSSCKILKYDINSLSCQSILSNTRHSKQIKCLQMLPCDPSIFCTGSEDHLVVIHGAMDVTVLRCHTSSVSSLTFVDKKLYSAGHDGRLNCIDVTSGRIVDTCKANGTRFSHLSGWQSSAVHSFSLLTSQQSCANDQFKLFDSRTSLKKCVNQFGWAESANTSHYLKFALQPNGHQLICGTQCPVDGISRLNIWDLRRTDRQGPARHGNFGGRRWLECCFLDDQRVIANATDSSLSFINLVY